MEFPARGKAQIAKSLNLHDFLGGAALLQFPFHALKLILFGGLDEEQLGSAGGLIEE